MRIIKETDKIRELRRRAIFEPLELSRFYLKNREKIYVVDEISKGDVRVLPRDKIEFIEQWLKANNIEKGRIGHEIAATLLERVLKREKIDVIKLQIDYVGNNYGGHFQVPDIKAQIRFRDCEARIACEVKTLYATPEAPSKIRGIESITAAKQLIQLLLALEDLNKSTKFVKIIVYNPSS